MKNTILNLSIALLSMIMITACSKDDSTNDPTASKDSFIQMDDSKNVPVTQKTDPYNRGQANSCFFGTTTLDLTTKTGSNAAIMQVILEYSIPNKTMPEGDIIAKALFDGIAEGSTIKVKVLGEDSRFVTPAEGFLLTGSVSAATGVWGYFYSEKNDAEIEISKVNGKLQFSISSPIKLSLGKAAGAGNPNYPGFEATIMFSLLIGL